MSPETAQACIDYADAWAAQQPPISDDVARRAAHILVQHLRPDAEQDS